MRDSVLRRERLEDRLDQNARLTLVAAPAGWGKTSLLSKWAAKRAAEHPVAWVSLDEGDDEPIRFWSYVVAAIRQVDHAIGDTALDALRAVGDGLTSLALPLLLNDLASTTTSLVLVLDDYHVITHAEVHESLEFVISHLPSHVRVVIGTRSDPPLPLARMRGRGELLELRARDLQFSDAESLALLSEVSRSEVDAGSAARILERTEGWAAGLQLAGLALASSAARGRDAGIVGADQRHLFDYFASEVLPSFAPEQRDLLTRAAPLELLSGSLCDAALGAEGSGAVLAGLERAGLFVVAVDHEGEWYRCHHLLRSAMGWSSHGEPDATTRDTLRRVAAWFLAHDRIDDAVRSLQDAREYEAAADLLESNRVWFVENGWAATMLDLGARQPEDSVSSGAALSLAYVATTCGMEDRIEHWLDVCARNASADSAIGGWRSLRAAELSLRGLFAVDRATPEDGVALLEESVALEAEAGTPDHPIAMISLANAYGLAGRFDEATPILARFWHWRNRIPLPTSIALQTAGQLALYLEAAGSFDELDSFLPEAVALADATEADWGGAAAGQVIVMIRIIEGRRSYARGDVGTAEAQLERGLWFAETSANPFWRVIALVFLADVRLAAGDRDSARNALVRAREAVDNEVVAPFVTGWLEAAENRISRSAVQTATHSGALYEALTERELSILRMLPGPATQREIGAALFLSINTVKGYNKSLYRKLAVSGRHEAVQVARRLGLI